MRHHEGRGIAGTLIVGPFVSVPVQPGRRHDGARGNLEDLRLFEPAYDVRHVSEFAASRMVLR